MKTNENEKRSTNTHNKVKALQNYHFSGIHASHIGAIKSCLDYYNIDSSISWLFGMTGHAFITVVDEQMMNPNVGLPEESFYKLAKNLGLQIEGYHKIISNDQFNSHQKKAWDKIRYAIDKNYPVFAKELDLGNETSLIYAYGNKGYYTHSWHEANGFHKGDGEIPWEMLGQNFCPCVECNERSLGPSTYLGELSKGGLLSVHWATKTKRVATERAFKEALQLVLQLNKKEEYMWGQKTYYSGIRAYDHWIDSVRKGTILGFNMGYYTDIWHESRHHAVMFLEEIQAQIKTPEVQKALQVYKSIKTAYKQLNDLFPWMQPKNKIEDPFRRKETVELLELIRDLEVKALKALKKLSLSFGDDN
ncbi:hypothetical protein [Chengkuizengella axinellae]|uniref:Uncharacterized protein n=1 Tax=Chengkuizengella axinellae TaxID=3064388 RepID=A0ABT9IU60_9BACL|nr:hypothetical protein [Chengkuizengella sp. 2205SS18-9]MDP5272891.1 hypothetical protein [Chengkuizengella sp. 2205SS18-9]